MFLRDADFILVPQLADFPHRRTNEAVNYFRQRFAFQMRGDKNIGCRLFTSGNQRLILNVCFNYGGRWDIAQAAQKLVARGEAISELSLDRAMALAHVPDPDLLIRTGGELRISNFLLWQAAYSELHFSDKLWPEFDANALDEAIAVFRSRERRFGQTSAQLGGALNGLDKNQTEKVA